MKWGLIPHWAKGNLLPNLGFSGCLGARPTVPHQTDGFYEWKKLDAKGKLKQPYAIAMADEDAQMVMVRFVGKMEIADEWGRGFESRCDPGVAPQNK